MSENVTTSFVLNYHILPHRKTQISGIRSCLCRSYITKSKAKTDTEGLLIYIKGDGAVTRCILSDAVRERHSVQLELAAAPSGCSSGWRSRFVDALMRLAVHLIMSLAHTLTMFDAATTYLLRYQSVRALHCVDCHSRRVERHHCGGWTSSASPDAASNSAPCKLSCCDAQIRRRVARQSLYNWPLPSVHLASRRPVWVFGCERTTFIFTCAASTSSGGDKPVQKPSQMRLTKRVAAISLVIFATPVREERFSRNPKEIA